MPGPVVSIDTMVARNDDDPLSARVITAIADHADAEPHRLNPPLYEAIDLDALDALARSDATAHVEFTYREYRVSVSTDGTVVVDDAATAEQPRASTCQ